MFESLSKLARKRREFGTLRALQIAAHNVLPQQAFDFSFLVVLALDLSDAPPDPAGVPGLRAATVDDAPRLAAFAAREETVRGRFANGMRAWLVERDGVVLACDWLGTDRRKRFWDWLVLEGGEDDIWHEYYEVAAPARGQGLGPALRAHVIAWCRQQGYRRLLGNVDLDNRRSRRAMAKLGYHEVARVAWFRFGRLSLVRHDGRWRTRAADARRRFVVPIR